MTITDVVVEFFVRVDMNELMGAESVGCWMADGIADNAN